MKMKFWMAVGVMISTGVVAQPATNEMAPIETPPPAPAVTGAVPEAAVSPAAVESQPEPVAAAPAAKPKAAPKKAPKKPAYQLRTVPLVPGPAVVSASRVNVRGQAKLRSEIITRMTNGEPVTVIEEVTLSHSGPEEPSAWAKITLPDKAKVWVYGDYIDPATKAVTATRLNVRGGPGENYSILGRLDKGEVVSEIKTDGKWIQIEAPTNAYAFMAAQYLTQEPAALASAAPAETAMVASAPAVAEASTETPEMAGGTNEVAEAAPSETDTNAIAPLEETPQPRIVWREGVVRDAVSIQAPTPYELISPDTRKIIDYLYTPTTNLDLSRYKGMRIIVSGEEGLDERWKNTPVIVIQRIQVVE